MLKILKTLKLIRFIDDLAYTAFDYLSFVTLGRLSDASACCEHAIQSQPSELVFRHGKLRNLLALGELNSALNIANSVITDR